MSGHNKWAQIKHRKAATDAVKSREFSRFARLIALESKKAGGRVDAPGLAAAIARAKAANMPKDNIERAVAKGTSKDAGSLEQVVYEAYGPGGVALIVEALTDNKNRTTQEVKHLLGKLGVELSAPGAASWAFARLPDGRYVPNEPLVELAGEDEERLGAILDALDEHEDVQRAFTNTRGYESTESEAEEE
ncbi:MAG: YebC/PmpR family DNA-binding transcriptional regulator [Patescibacteria group bacterium]|nr:YebC/PmpR family DNA-binding transcriptional regulator [Patescibacteria group bacterium]MDE1944645.1 YebC/PmpR family DNA-binding transcriptional regulator [Patescibacteria group bacterium]MDE1944717.1 YebC/PmpR family DNA-binding transcriptional regulator [Patescibacteria group bacterium]MDE2057261.1 YebC/PmpR family DNA-binding transcriptional regulator [Patescibacteria group bacterium]